MTEIELMVYDQKGNTPKIMPGVQTHNRHILKAEAEFAKGMIHSYGMLADNLEKVGNVKKNNLIDPEVVVERACTLAALAFAEFAKRGWIVPLPSHAEMREEIKAQIETGSDVGFTRQRIGPNGQAHPRS